MSSINGICVRHTDLPASTPLFTDFLYDFERVAAYYKYPPQPSAVRSAANEVQIGPQHRHALVEALREQNGGAGPATATHLDLLGSEGTVAVVAGQQVGLYGGPIFAVFKALTAVRLAEQLRSEGLPAVPVFWLATEDHDLAEVDHVWVFDNRKQPVRLQASAQAGSRQPVGGVTVADGAMESLQAALADAPYAKNALDLARSAYGGGSSFSAGFAALFRTLFDRYGLILIDPMHAGIRRVAAPVFQQAIERNAELDAALVERSRALEGAGYHAQVQVSDETALVFLIDEQQRRVLRRTDAGYSDGAGSYSPPELLSRLKQRPEDFSPSALLRPVVQDFILPTAAYVAGPSELCYLAQAEVLYSRLLGRMPVVLPRASFTVLDAEAHDFLRRHELSVTDCFEGPETLRRRVGEKLIPSALDTAFKQGEAGIRSSLQAIDESLAAFDPTLGSALATARSKMLYQLAKIRGKAVRESLRRNGQVQREIEALSNLVYPNKTHQERVYSVLAFLARHGPDFVERLYGAISPDCHDHQVLVL